MPASFLHKFLAFIANKALGNKGVNHQCPQAPLRLRCRNGAGKTVIRRDLLDRCDRLSGGTGQRCLHIIPRCTSSGLRQRKPLDPILPEQPPGAPPMAQNEIYSYGQLTTSRPPSLSFFPRPANHGTRGQAFRQTAGGYSILPRTPPLAGQYILNRRTLP